MKDIHFLENNGVNIPKSLELFGDADTYNETIGEFLVGIHSKINQLIKQMNAKDFVNYSVTAHSMKSDANTFGFTFMTNVNGPGQNRSMHFLATSGISSI